MSQENVEIVRGVIDAFNRGDWDSALKPAAPDFVFDNSRALGEQRGIYTSKEQVRGLCRDGIEVKARTTWLFSLRDAKVERVCMYQDQQEALDAAGPRE